MKRVRNILFILVAFYLIICAVMFIAQRKFLYFPPQTYYSPSAVNLPEMQEVEFSNTECWATAWWSPPATDNVKTVMVFHGNASAVYSLNDIYRDLIAEGYGVLGVGYSGYPGVSPQRSKPTQGCLVDLAIQQYDWLVEAAGVQKSHIVFFGTSLGSGVAAQLSAVRQPGLMIAEAPFNSVLDMGRRQMPFLPVGLLMKDTYRSDIALYEADFPLIWVHGTGDRVVPLLQGQKLFDGYRGPKTAHIIKGGQHNNLWPLGTKAIVLDALAHP